MSETVIVAQVLLALSAELGDRVRVWRQNTGALPDARGRLVRFGMPGAADLTGLFLGSGRRLEIECKTPTGRQSGKQIAYGKMIRAHGGVYLVARSAADAVRQVLAVIEETKAGDTAQQARQGE
jgi:hypothetical protein